MAVDETSVNLSLNNSKILNLSNRALNPPHIIGIERAKSEKRLGNVKTPSMANLLPQLSVVNEVDLSVMSSKKMNLK